MKKNNPGYYQGDILKKVPFIDSLWSNGFNGVARFGDYNIEEAMYSTEEKKLAELELSSKDHLSKLTSNNFSDEEMNSETLEIKVLVRSYYTEGKYPVVRVITSDNKIKKVVFEAGPDNLQFYEIMAKAIRQNPTRDKLAVISVKFDLVVTGQDAQGSKAYKPELNIVNLIKQIDPKDIFPPVDDELAS